MNPEEFREYCLSKPGVTEGFPFDETTLVLKVGGKIFALIGLDRPEFVNLKCDPERAIELREGFPDGIFGAYHMSKKHWNSVMCGGQVPNPLLKELIDHSYELILNSLLKKIRETIG